MSFASLLAAASETLGDKTIPAATTFNWDSFLWHLITSATYVTLGLIVFAIAFLIIQKFTPFSVRKEIEEDQNTALAIILGSVFIGIAIIIAAAIHGT